MYQTFLKPLFQDIKTFVFDTLFPITCVVCASEGEFLCITCRSQLKPLEHQQCIACQKPSPFGLTHPRCQSPHEADGLISFYDYHDQKVKDAIIAGKYQFLPKVFSILGLLIAKKLETNQFPLDCPILVPLPLAKPRLRWRGFNQAEILCQYLSKQFNWPIMQALRRIRSTKVQKDLKKREDRRKNMSGAFALSNHIDIDNRSIILVDDVTTTGSTLRQAAKVLKRNGAKSVWCLTVARD